MIQNCVKKIIAEWGSFEMWEKDFRAMGAMRGDRLGHSLLKKK